MRRKHPTTADVRAQVIRRDGSCVAPRIDKEAGPCMDAFGRRVDGPETLEVDHIRPEVGSTTVNDARWMVALCPWHHRVNRHGSVWATGHRTEIRDYLAALYGES